MRIRAQGIPAWKPLSYSWRVPEDTLAPIDQARGDDTRPAWVQRNAM